MTPQAILRELWAAGICLQLTSDGQNLSVPAGRLDADSRALILAHKPALVTFLQDAQASSKELIEAAMRVCDFHCDNASKREAMRLDCLTVPAHLRLDLLEHFQITHPQSTN